MNPAASRPATVQAHYEKHVYPDLPLLSSIRGCDAYALNIQALWGHFNGERLTSNTGRILLAGSGSFSPYPSALANPQARIIALDLSQANLRRARWHTRLHGYFNVDFVAGDLLNAVDLFGEKIFHFIDCYGVIHHIREAVAAGRMLHTLLKPGGLVRIMIYSRCARQAIESAGRALRLLQVSNVRQIKALYRRAKPGSRFRECLDATPDAAFDAGLADLFLHPYAKTYTVDELLEWLDQTDLQPLQFIHSGALLEINAEILRLRDLEKRGELSTNFILFAGRREDAAHRQHWQSIKTAGETLISINPVIRRFLPLLPIIPLQPAPRLGFANPLVDIRGKRLLARFKNPVRLTQIETSQRAAVDAYRRALFLFETAA